MYTQASPPTVFVIEHIDCTCNHGYILKIACVCHSHRVIHCYGGSCHSEALWCHWGDSLLSLAWCVINLHSCSQLQLYFENVNKYTSVLDYSQPPFVCLTGAKFLNVVEEFTCVT